MLGYIWEPHYKKDQKQLEKIQKRITKMIVNVKHLKYEDRLASLNFDNIKNKMSKI